MENTKIKRKDKQEKKEDHDHTFRKTRKRFQPTKKLGCPSKVVMSRILKFPDYMVAVGENGGKPERKMRAAAGLLKEDLREAKEVKIVDQFIMRLPGVESHEFHTMEGEGACLREPIDPIIVEKIKEMEVIGVRSVAEVRRHLRTFVQNELFRGKDLPPECSRRYYPTDGDIRNILYTSRIGERKAPDDQMNLDLKLNGWKETNPDDFIFFRPSAQEDQSKSQFLFVYQSQWMKRLLVLYGQEMCLMDATYRTCRYALPLFFLCVRSNVGYIVVAVFIPENEDADSISEVLRIIRKENPQWDPANMMVDFSLAEIAAINECFPKTHVHVCDFHREKAWNEWVSKYTNGVAENREEVLLYLRNIAKSSSRAALEENIATLKKSNVWKQSIHLQKYFSEFWGLHLEKWVRFYRDETLRVAIYTNNGIERQNNWLKQSYLERRRNNSITDLVEILITQFLPDSYKKYKENNIRCTESYRCYDSRVPKYLHNRPKYVVEHIMKRMDTEIKGALITQQTSKLFMVKSFQTKYQVWLGSESQLPSCQCMDFRTKKLPCKHICAVVQQPNVGWEAIGPYFDKHPLFSLDSVVIPSQAGVITDPGNTVKENTLPDTKTGSSDNSGVHHSPSKKENQADRSGSVMASLPSRKKPNIRQQCVQALKSLHDELYILTERDVLENTLKKITDALNYTRMHHRRENGITVKDKSLSPKKVKINKSRKLIKLAKRPRKDYFKKRVGSAADLRRETIDLDEGGDVLNRKRSKPQTVKSGKKKKRDAVDNQAATNAKNGNDVWITVNGIKLTYELRDILAQKIGWLTDDHIDAAQWLLKDLGTGVGGLNHIATMTHCSRFVVPHESHQTIQCHNIGGHWVTSSSVSGNVVVYESLTKNLNNSLKRQLVCLYKGLAKDDGSLNIAVVLQQRQIGTADCGLFSIANAVALANGIDPETVSWHQDKMRKHLQKCFEEKRIEMFPHDEKKITCTKSYYVVSIYCSCMKHVPGAEMIHCNVCKNWFHHGPQQKCLKLSATEVAALATDDPFICQYCKRDSSKSVSMSSILIS